MSDDIKKIAELLKAGREADVYHLEADLPFWTTSNHYGLMKVKATWKETP